MSSTQKLNLMALPDKIRDQILKELLFLDLDNLNLGGKYLLDPTQAPSRICMDVGAQSLFFVSKTLRAEAMRVYFSVNTFQIYHQKDFENYVSKHRALFDWYLKDMEDVYFGWKMLSDAADYYEAMNSRPASGRMLEGYDFTLHFMTRQAGEVWDKKYGTGVGRESDRVGSDDTDWSTTAHAESVLEPFIRSKVFVEEFDGMCLEWGVNRFAQLIVPFMASCKKIGCIVIQMERVDHVLKSG